jgi:hypothetical protein
MSNRRATRILTFLLAAITATIAAPDLVAQAPPTQNFYLRLSPAATTSTPELRDRERKIVIPEAQYWDYQRQAGKVVLYGVANEEGHAFTVVIVHVANEAEARSIAEADPSVHAGINTVKVLPFSVFLPAPSK